MHALCCHFWATNCLQFLCKSKDTKRLTQFSKFYYHSLLLLLIDYYFCRHDGDDFDSYSSVTAPYPPPPPEPRSKDDGYIQPSQEALQRLAGTASKRSKLEEESFNQIIDVNFDDIKPDEREWLTKALTEDDADKPGPKVITFKGQFNKIQQFKPILHSASRFLRGFCFVMFFTLFGWIWLKRRIID